MTIKVKVPFTDAVNNRFYKVGEIIELPDDRAKKAIERDLAVSVGKTAVKTETAEVTLKAETADVKVRPKRKK